MVDVATVSGSRPWKVWASSGRAPSTPPEGASGSRSPPGPGRVRGICGSCGPSGPGCAGCVGFCGLRRRAAGGGVGAALSARCGAPVGEQGGDGEGGGGGQGDEDGELVAPAV